MKALIPGLGALPWSPEQGSVSTGYELQDSLPSAWLQQPQTLVIEFSTPQQLANFFIAAAVVDNTTLTHADNGLARPYARVSSATTNARVISATTNPTQPGPEQAPCKHARVSGLICIFVHNQVLKRAPERQRAQTIDVGDDVCSGSATTDAPLPRPATTDARVEVASADAYSFLHHHPTRVTERESNISTTQVLTPEHAEPAATEMRACSHRKVCQ